MLDYNSACHSSYIHFLYAFIKALRESSIGVYLNARNIQWLSFQYNGESKTPEAWRDGSVVKNIFFCVCVCVSQIMYVCVYAHMPGQKRVSTFPGTGVSCHCELTNLGAGN